VQGGWLILNYGKYQADCQTKGKTGSKTENFNTDIETEIRLSEPIRLSKSEGQLNDQTNLPVYELSQKELLIRYGLNGLIENLFFILRNWAAIHAVRHGSSEFPVSAKYLAKKLNCTVPHVSGMLQKLVELGVIQKVKEHNYREGKSAMYRWIIESTIPIPSAPEPESDPDEEPLF
jgi:hypothetical protein